MECDEMLRHLLAAIGNQGTINDELRPCIQKQRLARTAGNPKGRHGMSEPLRDSMQRQLLGGRRSTPAALLPWEPRPGTETSIPGHLCEVCLDAPATRLQPAPWGGEMGL